MKPMCSLLLICNVSTIRIAFHIVIHRALTLPALLYDGRSGKFEMEQGKGADKDMTRVFIKKLH